MADSIQNTSVGYTSYAGAIPSVHIQSWNELAEKYGSAFQTYEWCQAFLQGWNGKFLERHITVLDHDHVVAAIPAYLYEQCSRVDYYRNAIPHLVIEDSILMSHALVGWYGFPFAASAKALSCAIGSFVEQARMAKAIAWFAGIDARDKTVFHSLTEAGFSLQPFQTIMVRSLKDVGQFDGLDVLTRNQRRYIRKALGYAQKANTRIRLASPHDFPAVIDMIDGVIRQKEIGPDVLPHTFIDALLHGDLPGLEVMVAENEGCVVGATINFKWGQTYSLWLGGHDRTTLSTYHQSHLLYEAGVQRAISLGCTEIQSGRSPYPIKFRHGYTPLRLWCAVWGSSPEQHVRATNWIEALKQRHYAIYPEVAFNQEVLVDER